MLPKKNQKAELESKRPMFFLTGISIAIVAVIIAFQWTSEKKIVIPQEPNISDGITVVEIPTTVRDMPEIPKQKKEVVNNEIIKIVDDLFKNEKLDLPEIFDDPTDIENGLAEIDGAEVGEAIETIPFILVEKVALPESCQHLTDRDEQVACLNQWMNNYIRKETKFPELAYSIGIRDKVYVNFIISETGTVESVKLARGEYDILNDEALRVIRAMPKIVPASQKNKPVRMSMTVPINFTY